jgi:Pirin-related protein
MPGTGITHAEYNEEDEATRLFQIWIMPDRTGVAPGWASREFPRATSSGLHILAGGRPGDAEAGALPLYADAAVLAARLAPGERATYQIAEGRAAYLVAPVGSFTVSSASLGGDPVHAEPRDGLAISNERAIVIEAGPSEPNWSLSTCADETSFICAACPRLEFHLYRTHGDRTVSKSDHRGSRPAFEMIITAPSIPTV